MNSKTNIEDTLPPFDFYIGNFLNTLSYMRISSGYNSTFVKSFCRIIITPIFLSSAILIFILEIIGCKDIYDLKSFSDHVSVMCFFFIGFTKWGCCIWKLKDLEGLIESLRVCHKLAIIDKNDKACQNYHKRMLEAKKTSQQLLLFWFFLTEGGLFQWFLNVILKDALKNANIDNSYGNATYSRSFAVPIWSPFDVDTVNKYWSQFFYQYFCAIVTGLGFIAGDIFNASIILYICVQLDFQIEALIDEESMQLILRSKNPGHKFKQKLKNSILHHKQILKVHRLFEEFSTEQAFMQCIANIIGLCLVSLTASTLQFNASLDFYIGLVALIAYWSGHVFEIALYCHYGTRLEYTGLKVADSFFSSNWEQLMTIKDDKLRKEILDLMIFGIMRAQIPITITAGPFYTMNLPTFKALMGMSLSNAVILRQLSEEA